MVKKNELALKARQNGSSWLYDVANDSGSAIVARPVNLSVATYRAGWFW